MKEPVVLLIASLLALLCASMIPSAVNAQPAPPQSVDSQWQPPDEGSSIDPPVNVEVYNYTIQGSHGLLVAPPSPVEPGVNTSIINAYLVNSYGQLLNMLYQGEMCYLILSVNGPGNLYIWEYYPSGPPYGHWLCYRWYRPGVGVWKIGPFTASANDPEGKYTWKLWYTSGHYWSTRIISFDYTRRFSPYAIPAPVTVQTPAPVQQPAYQPAAVNSFAASPSTIEAGQNVTLSWNTTNATGVSISPGIGTVSVSGSTMVAPATTTSYTLTASGRTGNPAISTVTVRVNPRITPTLSINRNSLPKGESAVLTWSAPGASQLSISGLGSLSPSGSMEVWPEATTVYTLTASYYDGSSQQASVTINVEETPVLLYSLLALLVTAAAVIVILLIRRSARRSQPTTPLPQQAATEAAPATAPAMTAPADTSVIIAPAARLTLPDGDEIVLAGSDRVFGRRDFEKFLPKDKLTYLSRQHFNISYAEGHYFMEDRASTNGTLVNGQEIRGAGKRALEDNDVIEVATKLKITFRINTAREVNNET